MSDIITLAERHILESQARLRHIDELVSRAESAGGSSPAGQTLAPLVAQARSERDKLEQHVSGLRDQPSGELPGLIARGEGLKGALETVGLQLEKALAAIF